MDKRREGDRERGEKSHSSYAALDPATAALYANMFGASSLGGMYAMNGMQGWGGLPPGYPPVSSAAGLASLAAAQQQAQQLQQAAALASLNPAAAAAYQDRAMGAAWWNIASLQQMELLSRLQGGMGGSSSGGLSNYAGLHPEHLMSLELLQAQQAAAMAAALSATSKTATSTSSSKSRQSSSGGSRKLGGGSYSSGSPISSSELRLGSSSSRSHTMSSSGQSRASVFPTYSSAHHYSSSQSRHDLTGSSSHKTNVSNYENLASSHSPSLSHGIANLIADRQPTHKRSSPSPSPRASNAERMAQRLANEGSVSISKAIRSKELEIIPLAPSKAPQSNRGGSPSNVSLARLLASVERSSNHERSSSNHERSSSNSPRVSISTVLSDHSAAVARLTNGCTVPGWREEKASVSIEPCRAPSPEGAEGGVFSLEEDAPLNLSMKTISANAKNAEKQLLQDSLSNSLNLSRPDFSSLDLSSGLIGGLNPSLEVLHSLYGQHSEPRDVLASMQEALQRQLLSADGRREEKRKRDTLDRSRHLGRGISKPKKNTVASLLEHCRASGLKPHLPITSLTPTPGGASGNSLRSIEALASYLTAVSSGQSSLSSSPSLLPSNLPSMSSSTPPPATSVNSPLPLSLLSLPSSVSISSVPAGGTSGQNNGTSRPSVSVLASIEDINDDDEHSHDNYVEITPLPQENGGSGGSERGAPTKKTHVVTSSSVSEGRLVTTIRATPMGGPPPESDSEGDSYEDDSSITSSMDDEGYIHPWLKRDQSPSGMSGSPPSKKRKMVTDEVSLRVPLMYGWRRETTVRSVTQSGVRGEVIYYAPCGKAFRQYPDIIRYLEKNGMTEVCRDNFSFSSKIVIGEHVDANTQERYSEGDIRERIRGLRAQRGLKPQRKFDWLGLIAKSAGSSRDALEVEAEAILRRLEAEEKAERNRREVFIQMEEQRQQIRLVREQEKMKKQDELRREKEDHRRLREEENRQRLYEQLRKAQERENEKQKQKLMREQLYIEEFNKQRELLYTLELERERRRYHGILVRSLEARKKYEEKEKRKEEIKEEKRVCREKKREERVAARELNLQLKEAKEDSDLTDQQPLPDINLLSGLRLPPEAFGNVLMVFEFLHNFGETLGFDMESLPSLQSLQLALMNDQESEEELLNVLSHLLVCAIEDPGVPSSQRHPTILNQTLNRADITQANISEIMRIYLFANATGEVRTIHGLTGTEKERRENPKRGEEYEIKLSETVAFRMSKWLSVLPFQALTATQKSEVVAFVCNDLLQNKSVVRQIEDSLERHNSLKTEKWKLDARIRKLRMTISRKKVLANVARVEPRVGGGGEDSNMSGVSVGEKEKENEEEDEEEENDSGNESDAILEEVPEEEGDKNLSNEEACKKLESLQRQMNQVRQDLFETSQQVRGFNCGQDRHQRTMWVLPHAGGPYLEGIGSCDYTGRQHFPAEVPVEMQKAGLNGEEVILKVEKDRQCKGEKIEIKCENQLQVKMKEEIKLENNDVKTDIKEERERTNSASSSEKLECESKLESDSDIPEISFRHPAESERTPKRDTRDNSPFLESSPFALNGLKDDSDSPSMVKSESGPREKLSFSLLPRTPCNVSSLMSTNTRLSTPKGGDTPRGISFYATPEVGTPNSVKSDASVCHREISERLTQDGELLPVPKKFKNGWWIINDTNELRELTSALNERGARERELKRFVEKNFTIIRNAVAKRSYKNLLIDTTVDSEALTLDLLEEGGDPIFYDELGVPVPDEASYWSSEISLRVELLALDAVVAMEEKITNASMQNKNWQTSDVDRTKTEFRASFIPPNGNPDDPRVNPVHFGRARLLALEDGIERRYLKPPLGVVANIKTETIDTEAVSPKGLTTWREAVGRCETAAQLAMCTYMLETAVAWDKSIMRAYCQFCHSGDFEEKLLLCDGCDKGYHTNCFKPSMENIPEGDWYCYECVNKFSETSQRHCLTCGGTEGRNLIHCIGCPRAYHTTCIVPPLAKVPRGKWSCPACASKTPKVRRGRVNKASESNSETPTPDTPAPPSLDETPSASPSLPPPLTPKKEKNSTKKRDQKDLIFCRSILTDLENHDDAWPFLVPVNTRQFPTYKKIIKKTMDLSSIKKKFEDSMYKTRIEFSEDIRLMFNNCEMFNEDDSPVGKAGHNLSTFFETKWNEHFPPI